MSDLTNAINMNNTRMNAELRSKMLEMRVRRVFRRLSPKAYDAVLQNQTGMMLNLVETFRLENSKALEYVSR